MLFIVTMKRPCPEGYTEPLMQGDGCGHDGGGAFHHPGCETCRDECEVTSRHAVATLEEARETAREACLYAPGSVDTIGQAVRVAFALPESGGTIGPLPDGTIIEVEKVANVWKFAEMVGEPAPAQQDRDDPRAAWPCPTCGHYSHPDRGTCTQCSLIATFNAKQAVNA